MFEAASDTLEGHLLQFILDMDDESSTFSEVDCEISAYSNDDDQSPALDV